MIVDANILLFADDEDSPFHQRARDWLTERLNGETRVGLPWSSLSAYIRISTHPRPSHAPLPVAEAWAQVRGWLEAPASWVPVPTRAHAEVFARLTTEHQCTGNLVPDAELAALAIQHGSAVASADTDFARFTPELTWVNPLA